MQRVRVSLVLGLFCASAEAKIVGPDSAGYFLVDGDSGVEHNAPPYSWTDISTTGTALPGCDDCLTTGIALPFSFSYYGTSYTSIDISTNGFVGFGLTGSYLGGPLPNTSAQNTAIALFSHDLNTDTQVTGSYNKGCGTIYHGSPAAGTFVVQWQAVCSYGESGTVTAQVVLKSDGSITLQYNTITLPLSSATVGIENQTGAVGLSYVYNEPGLKNALAVKASVGGALYSGTDAAVSYIAGISAQIATTEVLSPQVKVVNIGATAITGLSVRLTAKRGLGIDYDQTVTVASLGSGVSTTVSFPTWQASWKGTYTWTATVAAAGDGHAGDDTLSITSTAAGVATGEFRLNTVAGKVAADSDGVRVLAEAGGRVIAVWGDKRDGTVHDIYVRASANGGDTWGSEIRLDTGSAAGAADSYAPQLATNGAGRAYVLWADSRNSTRDLFLNRSADGGATWLGEVAIDTDTVGGVSDATLCAAAGLDRIYAVWSDDRSGDTRIYARTSGDGGATWAAAVEIGTIGGNQAAVAQWNARIACDGTRAVVVWTYQKSVGKPCNCRGGGGGPCPPGKVCTTRNDTQPGCGRDARPPRKRGWLAAAHDLFVSTAHAAILCTCVDTSDKYVTAAYTANSGTSWTKNVRIDDVAGGAQAMWNDPVIVAGATAGTFVVAWTDERTAGSPQVWFSRSTDGGATWSPDASLLAGSDRVSLVRDGSGALILAAQRQFSSGAAVRTRRSADGGATWGAAVQANAGGTPYLDMNHPAVAAAGTGRLFAAWRDLRFQNAARSGEDIGLNWSANGGATWQPSDLILSALPASSDRIYAAVAAAPAVSPNAAAYGTWFQYSGTGYDFYTNRLTAPCAEPNNSALPDRNDFVGAGVNCSLTIGGAPLGGQQTGGSDTSDFYSFQVATAGGHQADITITSAAQFDLYLYNDNGELFAKDAPGLAGTSGVGATRRAGPIFLNVGTWHIEVRYVSGTSSYDLDVETAVPLASRIVGLQAREVGNVVEIAFTLSDPTDVVAVQVGRGAQEVWEALGPALEPQFGLTDQPFAVDDPAPAEGIGYVVDLFLADGTVERYGPVAIEPVPEARPAGEKPSGWTCGATLQGPRPGTLAGVAAAALALAALEILRRRRAGGADVAHGA